jgi:hypothetical protein
MLSQLLASPQFAAFITGLVLTVFWAVVGRVGRFIEAQGDARKIAALVVIGKQLEALGYDGDKLAGKQGAPESWAPTMTPAEIEALHAKLAKQISDVINNPKVGP